MFVAALLSLAVAPLPQATPAFETVHIASADGLELTADLYAPHGDASTPFLVLCHQAGWSRGEYRETAPRLNALGFNCVALDQRSGGAVKGVRNESARAAEAQGLGTSYLDARQDIVATLRYARAHWAKGPLLVLGSSYSAGLVLELAGHEEGLVDGVLAFSPGEYFAKLGAGESFVRDGAAHVACPVFVTSARGEAAVWEPIFAAIPKDAKVSFLPTTKGHHGSRALWSEFPESEEVWAAVESFLGAFRPKSREPAGSAPSGS